MGEGGLETLEKLIGCTLEEAFALLSGRGVLATNWQPANKMPPSPVRGASWKARKRRSCRWFFEAAEGTRTLDLLHGKQTSVEPVDRTSPCKSGETAGPRRTGSAPEFSRFRRDSVHQLSTKTPSRSRTQASRAAASHGGCCERSRAFQSLGWGLLRVVSLGGGPAASACQAAAGAMLCRQSFRRFPVAVMRRHSDRAAARPRRKKRSARRLNLVSAKTGSIICWRWA
jgi:hypothetical protein